MLLSLEKQFLFIHVPKTAGSSITAALKPYCLPENRTFIRRISSHLPIREDAARVYIRQHDTALHVRRKLGAEQFSALYKFAVVRNPYDHAASYYRFLSQYPEHRHHRRTRNVSFLQFLKARARAAKRFDQSNMLVDGTGDLLMDRVLKFETLGSDFEEVCHILGLTSVELPSLNMTDRTQSNSLYCPETRRLVEQIYQDDFRLFGYEMSSSQ